MATRNRTVTGLFLRQRLKRHLILRIWDGIRDIILGRESGRIWQPTVPCRVCQASIEARVRFCNVCGALQKARTQETEEIRVMPAQETEAIRLGWVDTKRLYPVRIGELRPSQQYQVQKHAWLHEQIRARYPTDGEALIAACISGKGYLWLLDQLRARGDTALVEAYNRMPAKEEMRSGQTTSGK